MLHTKPAKKRDTWLEGSQQSGFLAGIYVHAEGNNKEISVPKADEDAAELSKVSIQTGINFGRYQKTPVKVTEENVPDGITSFANSGLRQLVLDNISKSEYSVPTPVV